MNSHQLCEVIGWSLGTLPNWKCPSSNHMAKGGWHKYKNTFLGDHRPVVVTNSSSSLVFDEPQVRENRCGRGDPTEAARSARICHL